MIDSRDGMKAWLGPAADDVTPEQFDRMLAVADWSMEYWPGDDMEDTREAAQAGALQYLLGDSSPRQIGQDLLLARLALGRALAAAQSVARLLCEDGTSEVEAGRVLGLDRMTIRKARGK